MNKPKMEVVKETPMRIPLFHPYLSPAAKKAATDVLDTKFIGQGAKIQEFEIEFGKKFRADYAISTNSCTSALQLAYRLAEFKKGDKVLVPLMTCSATIHPLLIQGATPVFVDIKEDFTVDPEDIRRKMDKDVKGIVVMHYGGTMCDMDSIMDIAKEYNVPVIEDTAQAVGAYYNGEKVQGYAGTIGDFGCFSFQAIKYMTTIDGGMLTVKDPDLYEKGKRIRWFGIDRDLKIKKGWEQFQDWKTRKMTYDVTEIGYKFHMNDFNAAMGMVGLRELDEVLEHYQRLFFTYKDCLKDVDGVKFLPTKRGDTHWLMTVLLDDRDGIAKKLRDKGVETNVVHIRSDVYSLFKPFVNGDTYPNTDAIELKYLCLPIHMHITEDQVKEICNIIKK